MEGQVRRILLAYDGGPSSRRALERTIELASGLGAEVGVVSVVPSRGSHAAVDPWNARATGAERLLEARRRLLEAGLVVSLLEPSGDVAPTIVRIAEEHGYDTIVVGSRGEGRLAAALHGSVSRAVAANARATVVVAR
jgi:nucleotide-binding universal stress UspA family protein